MFVSQLVLSVNDVGCFSNGGIPYLQMHDDEKEPRKHLDRNEKI